MNKKFRAYIVTIVLMVVMFVSYNFIAKDVNYSEDTNHTSKPVYTFESSEKKSVHKEYFPYFKEVEYESKTNDFSNFKYYKEFNSKYDSWFVGNLSFQYSHWDEKKQSFIGHFSGELKVYNTHN